MTRRYALVGLGSRAHLYVDALLGDWRDTGAIVALCDSNQTRMAYHNRRIQAAGLPPVPTYAPEDFATVLDAADVVVVTSVDATHARYVVAALDAGRDVVVEKPMATEAAACAAIAEAAERSAGRLIVTFNYRYSPRNSAVRQVLAEGRIGEVTAVHFEWSLDTLHGADYFRRWHRDPKNSGGLLVHKSTHHFDLVNWWLDAAPELVFAQQGLRFYGDTNPPAAELGPRPPRGHGAPGLGEDPFLLDLAADPTLKALYLDAEHEDGYLRDQDVFSPGVEISDTMSLLVRYDNRAQLTYALHAYAPWEGYRVVFNGTAGRLELDVVERAWTPREAAIDPSAAAHAFDDGYRERLTLHRHWERPEEVPIERGDGGHGGGDRLLLDDVLRGASDDPLGRQAGYPAGVRSVLTGVAANESARTGAPVRLVDGGCRIAG
ncbi:Gfo/Idh/MocA family protein [Streptomyces sp. NBRC 109706]|uniref:Gfo/Idh/MocA family protein n=1 Tax=Streptomyces sp. NBRC 109706 TaxID=1550035 RepID=UPI00078149E5|nr:Gfo/Idh/MocA family oxidoreductase [Streptomyces sp. NBRC 109706]